jgi:hypothetical protein
VVKGKILPSTGVYLHDYDGEGEFEIRQRNSSLWLDVNLKGAGTCCYFTTRAALERLETTLHEWLAEHPAESVAECETPPAA